MPSSSRPASPLNFSSSLEADTTRRTRNRSPDATANATTTRIAGPMRLGMYSKISIRKRLSGSVMSRMPNTSKKATRTKSINRKKTPREIHFSIDKDSAFSLPTNHSAIRLSISVFLSSTRTNTAQARATSHPITNTATAARISGSLGRHLVQKRFHDPPHNPPLLQFFASFLRPDYSIAVESSPTAKAM